MSYKNEDGIIWVMFLDQMKRDSTGKFLCGHLREKENAEDLKPPYKTQFSKKEQWVVIPYNPTFTSNTPHHMENQNLCTMCRL